MDAPWKEKINRDWPFIGPGTHEAIPVQNFILQIFYPEQQVLRDIVFSMGQAHSILMN